jgi:intracellular sulfur oxidation DsrE/DsrF family protein
MIKEYIFFKSSKENFNQTLRKNYLQKITNLQKGKEKILTESHSLKLVQQKDGLKFFNFQFKGRYQYIGEVLAKGGAVVVCGASGRGTTQLR